jgi:hypothetical protein
MPCSMLCSTLCLHLRVCMFSAACLNQHAPCCRPLQHHAQVLAKEQQEQARQAAALQQEHEQQLRQQLGQLAAKHQAERQELLVQAR